MRSRMELVWEPPMYGRAAAGQSVTRATYQPAETTTATAAAPTCQARRKSGVGAAHRYTRVNAGITRNAWSILARNAKPTSAPASTSQRVEARSRARVVAQ